MTELEIGDKVAMTAEWPGDDGALERHRTGLQGVVVAVDTNYVVVSQFGTTMIYGKNQVEKIAPTVTIELSEDDYALLEEQTIVERGMATEAFMAQLAGDLVSRRLRGLGGTRARAELGGE